MLAVRFNQSTPWWPGVRGSASPGALFNGASSPDHFRPPSGQPLAIDRSSLGHSSASATSRPSPSAPHRSEPSVRIILHKHSSRVLESVDQNAYVPGDSVSGTLLLSLPRPTPVRHVRVTLTGNISSETRDTAIVAPPKKQVLYRRSVLFGFDVTSGDRHYGEVQVDGSAQDPKQTTSVTWRQDQFPSNEIENVNCRDASASQRRLGDPPVEKGDKFSATLGRATLEPPINLDYFALDHTDENQVTEALFASSTSSSDYFRCASPPLSSCSVPGRVAQQLNQVLEDTSPVPADAVFPAGLHCFRFLLAFPDDPALPRSFEHSAASCRYQIRARVRIPSPTGTTSLECREGVRFLGSLDASDPRYSRKVDVTGRRTVGHFAWKTGYLEAKASVERTAFAPDENIRVTISIKNCSDSPYHVVAKLWQTVNCHDAWHETSSSTSCNLCTNSDISPSCASPALLPASVSLPEEYTVTAQDGAELPGYPWSCHAALTPRNSLSVATSIPTPVCRVGLPGEITARKLDCSMSIPVPRKLPPTLADSLVETSYELVINIKPVLHHTKRLKLVIPLVIADVAKSPPPPYTPEPRDHEISIAVSPLRSGTDAHAGG